MKIALKDIALLFEQMSQELLNIESVSIVVFIAVDVDSICTLKIFSVHPFLARKCSCARTYSTRSTLSPPTLSSRVASKSQRPTTGSKCSCLLTVEVLQISLSSGLSSRSRPRFSCLMFISRFTIKISKAPKYLQIQTQIKIVDDGKSQYENCPTQEELDKYDELNELELESDEDDSYDEAD